MKHAGRKEPVCREQWDACPGGETEAQRGSETSELVYMERVQVLPPEVRW